MKTKGLLVMMMVPFLLGCSGTSEASSSTSQSTITTITDGQGREVTIDKSKMNKVICIGAGALRYYSYIGDMRKVIAVEEIDSETTFGVGQALRPYYMANYDYLKTLPTIGKGGPAAQMADAEKIAAANPDVVVSFLSADKNTELQNTINKPVIGLSQGGDGVFDSTTLASFRVLGEVFNKQDRVNELTSYILESKVLFESLEETEDTYYCGGIGNWGQTSMYGTMLNFPVFKYAKLKPAIASFDDKTKGQVTVDMEALQAADPDHIFMDTAGINGFVSDYNKEGNKAKYDALKAFKNQETYLLMPYNAYYSNLEIQLMSTYYVASIAHEDFNLDLDKKMDEITNKFLGKGMYNDIKAHKYGLGGYQKTDLTTIDPIQ